MNAATPITHYEVLGVTDDADYAVIRGAYVALMKRYHPDVAGPSGTESTTRITAAWHVLQDSTRRAEYDRNLRQEAAQHADEETHHQEPKEFVDEWGQDDQWDPVADGEVIDGEIDDEVGPPPEPPPPTNPSNSFPPPGRRNTSHADEEPAVSIEHPTRRLPLTAAALALALLATLTFITVRGIPTFDLTGSGALTPAVVFAVVGVAVGGYFRPLTKGTTRDLLLYGAALAALAGAVEIADLGASRGPLRLLYPLLAGLAIGDILGTMLTEQRRLDRLISVKNLRRNNVFGSLPGGVEADMVETACRPLYDIPSLRMVHSPNETALFTHFLVCGNKVALTRGLVAPPGSFRWSGPSLLLDGERMPTQVLTADYPAFLTQVQQALPEGVTVSSWVAVQTTSSGPVHDLATDPDHPKVVDMATLRDHIATFLTENNDTALVSQETVYQSLLLAAS